MKLPVRNCLIKPRYHQNPAGDGTCLAGHKGKVFRKHLTLGSLFLPGCGIRLFLGKTRRHWISYMEFTGRGAFWSGYSGSLFSSVVFGWMGFFFKEITAAKLVDGGVGVGGGWRALSQKRGDSGCTAMTGIAEDVWRGGNMLTKIIYQSKWPRGPYCKGPASPPPHSHPTPSEWVHAAPGPSADTFVTLCHNSQHFKGASKQGPTWLKPIIKQMVIGVPFRPGAFWEHTERTSQDEGPALA